MTFPFSGEKMMASAPARRFLNLLAVVSVIVNHATTMTNFKHTKTSMVSYYSSSNLLLYTAIFIELKHYISKISVIVHILS